MTKGYVADRFRSLEVGKPIFPGEINRNQDDSILLSEALAGLWTSRTLPKIHTADYKMVVSATADTVTLATDIVFDVGGVIFDTADLTSRAFTIPDDSTKYLYAQVAADCGQAEDYDIEVEIPNPITRALTVSLTLEDDKVDSTPTKMLILKAVKGSAGAVPVVTLYANSGASLTEGGQTGQVAGLLVGKSDADTIVVSPGWCHLEDSTGATHQVSLSASTLDVSLSGDGVGYVYVSSAGVLSWSLTAPTLDAAKAGYYDATGDLRFLGSWRFSSGALVDGQRLGDGRVIWDSDLSLGAQTLNGFTDVDLSSYCPSIEDAVVLGSVVGKISNAAYFTARKNGTSGSGTNFIGAAVYTQESGFWFCLLDSGGLIEIDTGNVQVGTCRIAGYNEPR